MGIASKLLGTGVVRREHTVNGPRFFPVIEYFRDTEIQQLGLATRVDHYVGRLQIPLDHEVPMCVRDGIAHLQKQLENPARLQSFRELIDSDTGDVLHDQVRTPVLVAHIEQTRYPGVTESGKDLPFPEEPGSKRRQKRSVAQK